MVYSFVSHQNADITHHMASNTTKKNWQSL